MLRRSIVIFFSIILVSSVLTTVSFVEAKFPENLPDVSKAPQKVRVIQTENITAYARTLYTTFNDPANHESGSLFDGVARLSLPSSDGNTYGCTGTLLQTGKHVLTAAHCVTDSTGAVNLVSGGTATFQGTFGTEIIEIVGVTVHGSFDGDFIKGNDIAILELSNIASSGITRYDYATNDNSVGQVLQKIGYGWSGKLKTGEDPNNYPFGTKRDGQNRYDAFADVMYLGLGLQPSIHFVPQAIYQYDSDDGKPNHDAFDIFFNILDLGLGNNEVISSAGDSGGPTLADMDNDGIPDTVVGITSYGIILVFTNGPSSDCTKRFGSPFLDSSCGEFAGDTRVSYYSDWISSVLNPTKLLEIKVDPLTSTSTTYQVIVSGQISLGANANPPKDSVSPDGTTINGNLSPTGLGLDDYFFTGNIVSITADQHVFSFVDGVEVPNDSPPLKLLEIKVDPLTSTSTTYQVIVSGQISLGSNANPSSDILSTDGTTINGKLSPTGLGLDDYFFTGNIVSITADQHVFSFVDGVEVPNDSPSPS